MDIAQARSDADGQLDDGTLAEVIARAIAAALSWHLEAPEHTRNATTSSRTWKPAGGPRGAGGPPPRDFSGPPPRDRDFEEPRRGPYPQRNFDAPRRPDFDEPFRDDDFRPPPRPRSGPGGRPPPSGPRPGPRPGGRRPPTGRGGGGGGFGPRKPRRNG